MRESTSKFIVLDLLFKLKLFLKALLQAVGCFFVGFFRKLALWILNRVDPAFLGNRALAVEGSTAQVMTYSTTMTNHHLTRKPLLVDANSFSVHDDFFHYTLDGIIASEAVQRDFIQSLGSSAKVFVSQAALVESLKGYFNDQIGNRPEKRFDSEFVKSLSAFNDFLQDFQKNLDAYAPKTKLNFDSVFWPDPTAKGRPRSIFEEFPFAYENKFISSTTPIGSAGSCFAMEIAHFLQRQKFNYVITEGNKGNGYAALQENALVNSPAAWGTIFNTPSFRQLVERAFGIIETPKIVYADSVKGMENNQYFDPFREAIIFDSVASYEANYEHHLKAVRDALLQMKVFIITLGVNEVWYFRKDGSVISRFPSKIAPGMIGHKVLTVDDNLRELTAFLKTLRTFNPGIEVIVSVSPIPLNATFRGDRQHVITANCHSKATLRVVAEEFVNANKGVHYLPSYETVMYTAQSAWEADQRHVTKDTVAKVVKLFNRMFVQE